MLAFLLPVGGLLIALPVSVADGEVVDDGFEASPYNSEVCSQFERFYRKQFSGRVDYNACQVLYNYPNFSKQFRDFLKTYRKTYPNSTVERKAYATFAANLLFIMVESSREKLFKVSINEYADLTPEEFAKTHTGLTLGSAAPTLGETSWRGERLPDSWDWQKRGAVNSPPQNQGICNSCWAFAVAAAIEGQWKIQTGRLVQVSAQQFNDCTGYRMGCVRGGTLTTPVEAVAEKVALCSEASYPYTGKQGACMANRHCDQVIPQGAVKGYVNVRSNDMMALMSALVKNGPVPVGIEASNVVMFYSGGILSNRCGDRLNHAVVVIGYGTQHNTRYWRLKNSWGHSWGERGCFRLIRGVGGSGECGILAIPAYPVVEAWRVRIANINSSSQIGDTTSDEKLWQTGPALFIAVVIAIGCGIFSTIACCCCRRSKIRGLEEDLEEEDGEDGEEETEE